MPDNSLLRCPYCNGKATLNYSWVTEEWHVYCDNSACLVRPFVFKDTEAEAIEAWNTREEGSNGCF